MKFVRKNKYTIIAIVVLIVLVIGIFELRNILVPDEGKASYGDRLDDIEKHPLSDELFKNIEAKLKENTNILKVENKVHGKIINLIITVNDEMSRDDARGIANSTISLFENEELSFYSLQVYMKKDNDKLNDFPIIGYKGVDNTALSFTKDREIVSEETSDEK